jgi:hypothetical protein
MVQTSELGARLVKISDFFLFNHQEIIIEKRRRKKEKCCHHINKSQTQTTLACQSTKNK